MPADMSKTEEPTSPRPSEMAALGPAIALGTLAVQAWAEIGAEAVRFLRDRLQQDIKTQQAMLACTSLDEMRQVQAEFFTAAQEQYAAEAGRMLGLFGQAGSGLTTPPKARRYDDVPL